MTATVWIRLIILAATVTAVGAICVDQYLRVDPAQRSSAVIAGLIGSALGSASGIIARLKYGEAIAPTGSRPSPGWGLVTAGVIGITAVLANTLSAIGVISVVCFMGTLIVVVLVSFLTYPSGDKPN